MAVSYVTVSISVLAGLSILFLIIGTATDHWIRIEPYYEDFMWKGCVRRGDTFNRLGCERVGFRFTSADDGAAILLLQTFAVNASLVGKPYDLIYGGLWKGCKEKGSSTSCKEVDLSEGPRRRGEWYIAVKGLMVISILAYLLAIAMLIIAFLKEWKIAYIGLFLVLPFIFAICGLFLYTANSNVSLRYRNLYGWSYFLCAFGTIFTYIAAMACFIINCQRSSSKGYYRQ